MPAAAEIAQRAAELSASRFGDAPVIV